MKYDLARLALEARAEARVTEAARWRALTPAQRRDARKSFAAREQHLFEVDYLEEIGAVQAAETIETARLDVVELFLAEREAAREYKLGDARVAVGLPRVLSPIPAPPPKPKRRWKWIPPKLPGRKGHKQWL